MTTVMPVTEFRRWLGREAGRFSDEDLRGALEEAQPSKAEPPNVDVAPPPKSFAEKDIAKELIAAAGGFFEREGTGRYLYWNPKEKTAWWNVPDSEDPELTAKFVKRLKEIKGVDTVKAEPESSPRGEGWVMLWPRPEAFAEHRFSSTQFDLPEDIAEQIRDFAESIPDADVAKRPGTPHITARYGLTIDDAGEVAEKVAGFGRVPVVLGKMSLFKNPDADVLKIDVAAPRLKVLNQLLGELPNVETHGFSPHCTVAYLKPGTGEKYLSDRFRWVMLSFDTLYFSDRDENVTPIPLTKEAEQFAEVDPDAFVPGKRAPASLTISGVTYREGAFVPGAVAGSVEGVEASTKAQVFWRRPACPLRMFPPAWRSNSDGRYP